MSIENQNFARVSNFTLFETCLVEEMLLSQWQQFSRFSSALHTVRGDSL